VTSYGLIYIRLSLFLLKGHIQAQMSERELFLYSYIGIYDRSTEKFIYLDTDFIPSGSLKTNLCP